MPWKCTSCGESQPDEADTCWICWLARADSQSKAGAPPAVKNAGDSLCTICGPDPAAGADSCADYGAAASPGADEQDDVAAPGARGDRNCHACAKPLQPGATKCPACGRFTQDIERDRSRFRLLALSGVALIVLARVASFALLDMAAARPWYTGAAMARPWAVWLPLTAAAALAVFAGATWLRVYRRLGGQLWL